MTIVAGEGKKSEIVGGRGGIPPEREGSWRRGEPRGGGGGGAQAKLACSGQGRGGRGEVFKEGGGRGGEEEGEEGG